MLEDDLVALNLGVEWGKRLERADRRLDEERCDAETDTVLLGERLLPPLAETHDRAHVHLVEGREHRSVVLRLDQTTRNGGAALRHALALFATWREGACWAGAVGAAGAAGAGGATGVFARRTSFFITRPPAPVAATASSFTPASRATFRAVGVALTSGASGATGALGAVRFTGAAGAVRFTGEAGAAGARRCAGRGGVTVATGIERGEHFADFDVRRPRRV